MPLSMSISNRDKSNTANEQMMRLQNKNIDLVKICVCASLFLLMEILLCLARGQIHTASNLQEQHHQLPKKYRNMHKI